MAIQKTNAQLVALLKPYFKSRTDPSRTTLYTFNASTPPTSAEMATGVCAANLMKDDYLMLLDEGGNGDNFYLMHPDRANNVWRPVLLDPSVLERVDGTGDQTLGVGFANLIVVAFASSIYLHKAADFTYSSGEITVNKDCLLQHNVSVSYYVTSGSTMTAVSTSLQRDGGGGWAGHTGSVAYSSHLNTTDGYGSASISRIIEHTGGDKIRVAAYAISGGGGNTIKTAPSASVWSILQVG